MEIVENFFVQRSIFNFFILSIYFEFWEKEFCREKIRFTRAWSHRLTFPLSETQKNTGGGERGQLNVTYRSLNETNGARWLCCMHKWRGSPATRLLSSGYFWKPPTTRMMNGNEQCNCVYGHDFSMPGMRIPRHRADSTTILIIFPSDFRYYYTPITLANGSN